MNSTDYEYANPNAGSLMQSLRAFGYDISTAIADLIDNSITANAKNIDICFDWNDGDPRVYIADDGCGMTEQELVAAMRTGSRSPLEERDGNDLGRFGLGLKTASFSQCKSLTVGAKSISSPVCIRCWDLDVVTRENDWILLKKAPSAASPLIDEHFKTREHGTIVIWGKLDRIVPGVHLSDEEYQKAFLEYARTVKNHIRTVFSSYMQGPNKISEMYPKK